AMTAPEQGGSSPEKEGMQIGATESNLIGEKEVSAVAVTAEVGEANMVRVFSTVADLSSGSLERRNISEGEEVEIPKEVKQGEEILLRESAVKGSLAANDSGNAQSARSDPADTGASKSQKKTMSAVSRSKQLFEPKSPATLATAKGSGSLYECSSKMATPIVTLAGVEKPSEILKPAAKQPVKETVIDEISSPSRFSSISGMEDGFYNGDDEEVNCDEKPFEDDRVECQRVKLVESKNPKLTKQRETFGTVTRASTRASQSLHTDGKCGSNSP
ncbi:LOW QUALITY PROTEIN: hypothetical protein HID58_066925, partial [Brassica napus]